MTKLYKSKVATTPHIISAYKLRDFLSAKESIEETGRSYAYVCQRETQINTTNYEPFIMSEDVFEEAYEEMK